MIASSGNIAERSEKREIQERKQEMKDKFQMSVEDNSDFAKRIIVDSIYREARVEGINVTFPETQQIYDGLVVSKETPKYFTASFFIPITLDVANCTAASFNPIPTIFNASKLHNPILIKLFFLSLISCM